MLSNFDEGHGFQVDVGYRRQQVRSTTTEVTLTTTDLGLALIGILGPRCGVTLG